MRGVRATKKTLNAQRVLEIWEAAPASNVPPPSNMQATYLGPTSWSSSRSKACPQHPHLGCTHRRNLGYGNNSLLDTVCGTKAPQQPHRHKRGPPQACKEPVERERMTYVSGHADMQSWHSIHLGLRPAQQNLGDVPGHNTHPTLSFMRVKMTSFHGDRQS